MTTKERIVYLQGVLIILMDLGFVSIESGNALIKKMDDSNRAHEAEVLAWINASIKTATLYQKADNAIREMQPENFLKVHHDLYSHYRGISLQDVINILRKYEEKNRLKNKQRAATA